MAYYENLTKAYSITKTIRNELIPIGATAEYIVKNNILSSDAQIAENYQKAKKILDEYHRKIITDSMENCELLGLTEVAELYFKPNRSDKDNEELERLFKNLRHQVVATLKNNDRYANLFGKKLITQDLPKFVETEEDYDVIMSFEKYTTYFKEYHTSRKNLYSEDNKHSTVAYRVINENLPKFLSNIRIYNKAIDRGVNINIDEESLYSMFTPENYSYFLTQDGIDSYNAYIGVANSSTNLFNQQHAKEKDFKKIPMMTPLCKQILSISDKAFAIDKFSDDDELLDTLESFAAEFNELITSGKINEFIDILNNSNGNGICVKTDGDLSALSNIILDYYSGMDSIIKDAYDLHYKGKKTGEAYEKAKKTELNKHKSYYVNEIIKFANEINYSDEINFSLYCDKLYENQENIVTNYNMLLDDVYTKHDRTKSVAKNTKAIEAIKAYLDSIKTFERNLKLIRGTGLEIDNNDEVYGLYSVLMEEITRVDRLYNLTRNYITKKPFSTEKIKINFNNATCLDGWVNETQYQGLILRKDNKYYLGILDTSAKQAFQHIPEVSGDTYEKMTMYQVATKSLQNLMVIDGKTVNVTGRNENGVNYILEEKKNTYLPAKINEIRKKESYKENKKNPEVFNKDDLIAFIDYYKERVIEYFDNKCSFTFKDSKDYSSFDEFKADVAEQGFSLYFEDISVSYIDELVDAGKLYLFQIYNKDFSDLSKGKPNLHTLYFQMLFDERNLKDVVYKINGGAQIFYRPASIDSEHQIVHPKNVGIKNKNPLRASEKPESTFDYDIVKNKRYTKDKFLFHLPIEMNFKSSNFTSAAQFNNMVNNVIRTDKNVRVIGIDRGERNLLYIVVLDTDGTILEQRSLNSIVFSHEGYTIETDYHELLDQKEKSRDHARKNWKTIESIKDIKEGYLSHIVHVVAELIIKYNAIVVLEDLNFGFMRGRQKVEKSVYQKFEKMLIEKLNYLVLDKSREQLNPTAIGGVLNALQLTSKFESFESIGKQTGIIYYMPAFLTSKIDPTTGFANFFYVKYKNIKLSKEFFSKFEKISYNTDKKYFEFAFDYDDFTSKAQDTKTNWTICSVGERIEHFRNPQKNNNYDERIVVPTTILEDLFNKYGIEYISGRDLVDDISSQADKNFYTTLFYAFRMIVTMRNSSADGTDYIQSPVMNKNGEFFNSSESDNSLPQDADANGAYNIARKGLWVLNQIYNTPIDQPLMLAMSNKEWLLYAQNV